MANRSWQKDSRKYTAFKYKNKCYQFKVVPFTLVTSSAAIVKCLEVALGYDVDFVSIFVDPYVMSVLYEQLFGEVVLSCAVT